MKVGHVNNAIITQPLDTKLLLARKSVTEIRN